MPKADSQFQPGQSGNPAGRPKGSRSRTALALEAILEGDAEAITRKAIELAIGGDAPALRLCMDRLIPVRKDRLVQFELPEIVTAADLPKATSALLKAVSSGEITPAEAANAAQAVEMHVKAIHLNDVLGRLAQLEAGRQ